MFGRLKDWRRVATRYDRCPIVFLCATALAATEPEKLKELIDEWFAYAHETGVVLPQEP